MGSDPYAGYLQANSEQWWFIGSAPEYAGGDSFNGLTQSWSGFYADRNGWRKSLRVFRMTRARLEWSNGSVSIGENPDRRIYRGENVLLYYEGSDPEVGAVLEKLFGEPVADGRR